jgi:hypothetical protein
MAVTPKSKQAERSALDVIETATHLLRRAPADVFATYFVGTIPFALGFLYFWADMSRSNQAQEYHAEASFALALLFAWMKLWQSVFANQLMALLLTRDVPRFSLAKLARLGLVQTIIQASGFIVLPISALIMLPAGWAYAFYQNATVLADGESTDVRDIVKRALRQSNESPRQNHFIIAILSLFAMFVWANIATVAFLIPQLLKTFFGIETVFSQSPFAFLNTTFLAVVSAVTYLAADPLVKAVYAVRCFYGDAVQSGGDIKVELRVVSSTRKLITALFFVAATLACMSTSVQAAEISAEKADAAPVNSARLDRHITEVLERREFTWRMPREKAAETPHEDGMVDKFFQAIGNFLKSAVMWIGRNLKALVEWIIDKLSLGSGDAAPGENGWNLTRILVVAILAAAVGVLLWIAWKAFRKRARPAVVAVEVQAAPMPDLHDENLVADQLPEDGWLKMAEELFSKGDLRLALRALYLASLASLGRRGLIVIARYKSNREYDQELNRRARKQEELLAAFGNMVAMFERVWYGSHLATPEMFQQFRVNAEKMKEQRTS